MCNYLNKTNTKRLLSDSNYLKFLDDKLLNKLKLQKIEKINNELNIIPKFNEHDLLLKYNYNLKQLKQIAKAYELKITGNKTELVSRIYVFLYLSNLVIRVQKLTRKYLQRKYEELHGPAFNDRSLCVNNFDFLSMDEVKDIENEQFFSFKDEDGFIYGFDILSLHNLIYKCNGAVKNPFNQKPMTGEIIEKFRSLLRLSRVLKINISTTISDVSKDVSAKKLIELRTITLFLNIDTLGNYSNPEWFLSLNRNNLIKYIQKLRDIWEYRANLTLEIKKQICHPSGNPFNRMKSINIIQNLENIDDIRKEILLVLENLVNTGVDKENRCLGAYYVLCALTLVNNDAATTLPWLYEASYHV
jgi:hypothetical protein